MQVFTWGCDWLFPSPNPAGTQMSIEVVWSLAIVGLCIIPGFVGDSLALLGVVGGSQRVTAMPFLQGRWTVGRGCAWCPGGRKARRSGTWGTHPMSFAWPFRRMASTWYEDRGVGRWPWGVFSWDPGGKVSCPDVPCQVKAAPTPCRVKNGCLGHPKATEWEWRQGWAVGLQGAGLRRPLLCARLRETGTS